jgi:hypothetical protein
MFDGTMQHRVPATIDFGLVGSIGMFLFHSGRLFAFVHPIIMLFAAFGVGGFSLWAGVGVWRSASMKDIRGFSVVMRILARAVVLILGFCDIFWGIVTVAITLAQILRSL